MPPHTDSSDEETSKISEQKMKMIMLIKERVDELNSVIDFYKSMGLNTQSEIQFCSKILNGDNEQRAAFEDILVNTEIPVDGDKQLVLEGNTWINEPIPSCSEPTGKNTKSDKENVNKPVQNFRNKKSRRRKNKRKPVVEKKPTVDVNVSSSSNDSNPLHGMIPGSRRRISRTVVNPIEKRSDFDETMSKLEKTLNKLEMHDRKPRHSQLQLSPEEGEDAWINVPGTSKQTEIVYRPKYLAVVAEAPKRRADGVSSRAVHDPLFEQRRLEEEETEENGEKVQEVSEEEYKAINSMLFMKHQHHAEFVVRHLELTLDKFFTDPAFASKYGYPAAEKMLERALLRRIHITENDLLTVEFKVFQRCMARMVSLQHFMILVNSRQPADAKFRETEQFFISNFSKWFHDNITPEDDVLIEMDGLEDQAKDFVTVLNLGDDDAGVYRLAKHSIINQLAYYTKNPKVVNGKDMKKVYTLLSQQLNFPEFGAATMMSHIDEAVLPKTMTEVVDEIIFIRTLLAVLKVDTEYGEIEFY